MKQVVVLFAHWPLRKETVTLTGRVLHPDLSFHFSSFQRKFPRACFNSGFTAKHFLSSIENKQKVPAGANKNRLSWQPHTSWECFSKWSHANFVSDVSCIYSSQTLTALMVCAQGRPVTERVGGLTGTYRLTCQAQGEWDGFNRLWMFIVLFGKCNEGCAFVVRQILLCVLSRSEHRRARTASLLRWAQPSQHNAMSFATWAFRNAFMQLCLSVGTNMGLQESGLQSDCKILWPKRFRFLKGYRQQNSMNNILGIPRFWPLDPRFVVSNCALFMFMHLSVKNRHTFGNLQRITRQVRVKRRILSHCSLLATKSNFATSIKKIISCLK